MVHLQLLKNMGSSHSQDHPFLRGSMYVQTFCIFCLIHLVTLFWNRCWFPSSTTLQESVDALINCVTENIGFSEGKPIAAITIYKCLVHWKIFETEKTSVFDRLIQIFGSAMQVSLLVLTICAPFCQLLLFHNHSVPEMHDNFINILLQKWLLLYVRNTIAMRILHTGYQLHQLYWLCCKRA